MALSEQEQRLLEQMEAALAAEDPKLASTLRGTRAHRLHRRRAALAGIGFLVGTAALVAGMELNVIVSIVGFVVMLASAILALASWQQITFDAAAGTPQMPKSPTHDNPFMDRLDERRRRHQDEGF